MLRQVVVSDSSVLIDLERGALFDAAFGLRIQFCVPDLLFRRELEPYDGDRLLAKGLQVLELDGEGVINAARYHQSVRALSQSDAFAWRLRARSLYSAYRRCASEAARNCRKGRLPRSPLANRRDVPNQSATPKQLHEGLLKIRDHPRSRLPRAEVNKRLQISSAPAAAPKPCPGSRFRFEGGRCPSGPGSRASHRAPAQPGLGPFGLRSLSQVPRRPHAGSSVAWLRGCRRAAASASRQFRKSRRLVGMWTRPAAPAPVSQPACGDGAKANPAGAGYRRLRISSAFARGGGSSSQMSSPGNTMPSTRLPSASTARKRLAAPEREARCRWRPSRATRLRTVAGASSRPAANASKQAGATTYASPAMLCSQAPPALNGTEPSRSPARTQLIHSQPAPSPPIAGDGVRSGAGSAVAPCGLRGVRAVSRAFYRRRRIGGGHGRPAIERKADPALRLLGDRAQLAWALAAVGGEGAQRRRLLSEPAEPGLAGEPGLRRASTARKRLVALERDARIRWRPSRTTRLQTMAAATSRPAANASKQAGATAYASPASGLWRCAPSGASSSASRTATTPYPWSAALLCPCGREANAVSIAASCAAFLRSRRDVVGRARQFPNRSLTSHRLTVVT